MSYARIRKRETALSVGINMGLSLAFFLGVFGWTRGPLAMGSPDHFALDFLPQCMAVAFMAALVPSFVTRGALVRSGELARGHAPSGKAIVGRALYALMLGALIGAGLALGGTFGPLARVDWTAALIFKLALGGVLGGLVTRSVLDGHFRKRVAAGYEETQR